MSVPADILPALRREERICELAIKDLLKRSRVFEERFGMDSAVFARKFEAGELGDDEELFEWRALVDGLNRWRSIRTKLREMSA